MGRRRGAANVARGAGEEIAASGPRKMILQRRREADASRVGALVPGETGDDVRHRVGRRAPRLAQARWPLPAQKRHACLSFFASAAHELRRRTAGIRPARRLLELRVGEAGEVVARERAKSACPG